MRSSSASKSGATFSPLLSLYDSFLQLGSEAVDGLEADGLVVNSDVLVVVEVATGFLTWELMDLIISCIAVTSALPW